MLILLLSGLLFQGAASPDSINENHVWRAERQRRARPTASRAADDRVAVQKDAEDACFVRPSEERRINVDSARNLIVFDHRAPGADAATNVVIARVQSGRSLASGKRETIYSAFQLKVEEVVIGPDPGKGLRILREGGTIPTNDGGEVFLELADRSLPAKGERGVFYLKKCGGAYMLLDGFVIYDASRLIPLNFSSASVDKARKGLLRLLEESRGAGK